MHDGKAKMPELIALADLPVLQQIHLGSFNTEEEAAQAFDQEAIRLRGANTFTNFPSNTYLNGKVEKDDITAQPQKRPHNQSR